VDLPEPDFPYMKISPLSGNFSETLSKALTDTAFFPLGM
jgi:hypothetical protein